MFGGKRRLGRERKTIDAMIEVYCEGCHGSSGGLCPSCGELAAYAALRLDRCPFGTEKPTCVGCPVHCYKPSMRERVRVVMRYAGPRMLLRHPYLALMHVVDGWEKAPERPRRPASAPRA